MMTAALKTNNTKNTTGDSEQVQQLKASGNMVRQN
jgi:hypothetical protein